MAYASHIRGICQRCGFEFRRNQIHKEWTGLLVCKGPGTNQCFDKRHPQEFVRGKPDKQSIPNPAPEPADLMLPPPNSDYHLDFVNNQSWQGATHLGGVSELLSGTLNLSSSGLTVEDGDDYEFASGILSLVQTNVATVVVAGSGVTGSRIVAGNGTRSLLEISDSDTVGSWNVANYLEAHAGSGNFSGAFKIAIGFDSSPTRSLVFNDGGVVSDTNSAGAALFTDLYLGGDGGSNAYAEGLYSSCTFYSSRLSDAALKLLTL